MEIIIIGSGGHSKVVQDMISSIKNYEVIAILDDKYANIKEHKGIIHAPILFFEKFMKADIKVVIAIGNNATRKLLVKKLKISREQFLTVVHPTAVVSSTATLGCGTVVMPNAIINAEATVGEHCIINSGAIVEHENSVGHYSHISPNATLTGNVSVGEGVHVGALATIIPGIRIGDWTVIGAGSTVIEAIPANSKAVGSPTRLLNNYNGKEKSEDKVVMLYDKS